jgi:hypothetical protein
VERIRGEAQKLGPRGVNFKEKNEDLTSPIETLLGFPSF